MTDRTAPIELVQAAVGLGLRTGMDVNDVLARAGVSPMLLADGRSRVTNDQITQIVQGLWRSTDDEMFGLGPAPLPRGSFRMLCYGMLSAPDLGNALVRFEGFAAAIPALPTVRIETSGGSARVTLSVAPSHDLDGIASGIGLVVIHRVLGWVVGQPLPLTYVELPTDTISDETHRLLFGVSATIGQSATIEFDAEHLAAPIVRDEAALEEFIASSPAGLLSRPGRETTVSAQVKRIVEQGLKARDLPSAEQVAGRLAMSQQTLRRKLAEEGVSLRQIREDLLRDTAVTSLVRGEESVAELSERLGFSEPSAFTRAFRRWTGGTPGAYRPGSDSKH